MHQSSWLGIGHINLSLFAVDIDIHGNVGKLFSTMICNWWHSHLIVALIESQAISMQTTSVTSFYTLFIHTLESSLQFQIVEFRQTYASVSLGGTKKHEVFIAFLNNQ